MVSRIHQIPTITPAVTGFTFGGVEQFRYLLLVQLGFLPHSIRRFNEAFYVAAFFTSFKSIVSRLRSSLNPRFGDGEGTFSSFACLLAAAGQGGKSATAHHGVFQNKRVVTRGV